MDRRQSLKQLALASGALVALPSWARGWSPDELVFDSAFTGDQQKMISLVADAIIPAGDSIGALTVETDKFLDRLFSDCYEEADRSGIMVMLDEVEKISHAVHKRSFGKCTQEQKLETLESIASSDNQDVRESFNRFKGETIRGFRTSKVVMTEYLDYQVIPAHFNGCVDVNA